MAIAAGAAAVGGGIIWLWNNRNSESAPADVRFTYFDIFAKGSATVLALEFSGLDWQGKQVPIGSEEWKTLKGMTPWRHVPLLEFNTGETIGHEAAILNYIGRKVPKMAGESDKVASYHHNIDLWSSSRLVFFADQCVACRTLWCRSSSVRKPQTSGPK